MTDFTISYHGSISLLTPISAAAKEWVAERISDDAQWFGHAVMIEHRYVDDVVNDAMAAGFEVEDV
jgi:hypothetical protein